MPDQAEFLNQRTVLGDLRSGIWDPVSGIWYLASGIWTGEVHSVLYPTAFRSGIIIR
jgi:hypothetical protein